MASFGTIQFGLKQIFLSFVAFMLFLTLTIIHLYGESRFMKQYYDLPIFRAIRNRIGTIGYLGYQELPSLNCTAGIPCVYEEEVDLRIIVITHDRKVSVMKLLESLQGLDLDGDTAVLEIWIDPKQDGTVHKETLEAVSNFTWLKGPTRIHVQTAHVGIMGQWIDTWRPKNAPPFQKDPKVVEKSLFIPRNYKEIGLILEDDLNVSTQAYRWLKAVHRKYNGRYDYAGSSLWSDGVAAHNTGRGMSGECLFSIYF